MHIKEAIISNIAVIKLINKSLGKSRYIVFLLINVLMPILLVLLYITNELLFHTKALLFMQAMFPLASVLNIVFSTKNFLDIDGNEIFNFKNNRKIFTIYLIMFLCKIINIFIFIFVLQIFTQSFHYEAVRIISASVFLFGLVNLSSVLFRSTSITLMICLLYVFCNMTLIEEVPQILFYASNNFISRQHIILVAFPLLSVGFIMIIISIIINKVYITYR